MHKDFTKTSYVIVQQTRDENNWFTNNTALYDDKLRFSLMQNKTLTYSLGDVRARLRDD